MESKRVITSYFDVSLIILTAYKYVLISKIEYNLYTITTTFVSIIFTAIIICLNIRET